ncbi:MAG: hypothetical protein AAB901_01600 [Patescibacteria group bacterium]
MAVEFNDESQDEYQRSAHARSAGFSVIPWLIKKGWVRDQKQGDMLLVTIILLCVIVSGFMIYNVFVSPVEIVPTQQPSIQVHFHT